MGSIAVRIAEKNAAVSVSVSVLGVGTIWRKKEESLKLVGVPGFFVELLARFELATSSLPMAILPFYAVWESVKKC